MRQTTAVRLVIAMMLAPLLSAWVVAGQRSATAQSAVPQAPSQDDQAYLCPMHPDIISDVPGSCPRCRMKLVLGRPYDMRDYRVELRTKPAIVRVGERV